MSVCQDQQSFNTAFKKALDNAEKEECTTTRCKVTVTVMVILMLILYIWAIILSLRVQDKDHRIIHLVLALAFGPLYVLAYYGSMFAM
jgi:hypothetical protein